MAHQSFPPMAHGLPDLSLEQMWATKGYRHIAGIDEAGRGPLAGPVVAAAVILNFEDYPSGLDDSKRLSETKRLGLFERILTSARAVSIASVSAENIDQINIRQATLRAMTNAAYGLATGFDYCLVDGRDVPEGLKDKATSYIKGDSRSASIAAASIVAKTIRDRMMIHLNDEDYGLSRHKGYGSQHHRSAIEQKGGIIRIHRFSFAPLKNHSG